MTLPLRCTFPKRVIPDSSDSRVRAREGMPCERGLWVREHRSLLVALGQEDGRLRSSRG